MPAKSRSNQQPSLFPKQPVPEMPEGYYSSGPNPNLRQFVEEHATPYDPETDDYNVPPFDQPITTTKATAIYNMHTYWSKKPHDAIRQYIRHYTKPGDIVMDPMCGSGGTALAALMEGRAAIAIDLSPAATFITKNYCTPVDVDELQAAFEELKRKVQPEMDWLYETRCDRCDGRATIGYTVYSQVFQCPRCLEKVVLFDCITATGLTAKGKTKKIKVCPYCYGYGHKEEIRSQSQKFGHIPVLVSYLCQDGCKPKRNERHYNDTDPKKRLFFQRYDLGKLEQIEEKEIPYWYPIGYDMSGFSRYQRDALWLYGVKEVADLFTKRNLWALAALREANSSFDLLNFALTGICLNTSIMIRESNTQYLSGTFYIPQISKEVNVWNSFSRRVAQLNNYWNSEESTISTTHALISTRSAIDLGEISSNTIDYIFTDPPYGGKIQYGELNYIWEAWMNFDTSWHNREVIVNKTRGITENDWAYLIVQAMRECYRVLKPGRWLSLCYHDTSEGTWQLLQDLMAKIGFISQRGEETIYIDKTEKSYNQYTASKVTKRDLVINFRKPHESELSAQLPMFGEADFASFQQAAWLVLSEALTEHPGAPADRLYDELVSRLVRKGQFERHDFNELLRSIAEEVEGRWYLLETADQVDEAESHKEIDAASRLENFMRQYLEGHPGEPGVHYSDLFEQYLPVQDKPRRLIQEWMPEFFFKTADGTWRPPANEEEREQKEVLRASGTLRRIKRFANALIEGVPPHERDIPPNEATAADWIRQCRRAGLYDQGRALYEKGGFSFDGLGEEAQMEVEEDYQICVRRNAK